MSRRIAGFFCSGLMATAAMVATFPMPASVADNFINTTFGVAE